MKVAALLIMDEIEKKETRKKLSPAAVWLGRFVGVFLVPILFLFLLEGCLRVVGLREPMAFFIPNHERKGELTTNLKFGWQYFPAPIARWPRPQVIAQEKPAGQARVVVLGESAAFGTPSELYGFPHQLEVLLDTALQNVGQAGSVTDWQVINAAMTAINSHTLYQISRELPKVEPDFVVLYIGNNEVIGPYSGGSVFGTAFESLGAIRAMIALRKTAIGQVIGGAASGSSGDNNDMQWQGLANFLEHQVTIDDPRMPIVYAHFEENMRDIIARSHAAGARVVLCTMAVNLVDSPPFASALPENWSEAESAEFEKDLEQASDLLLAGDTASARDLLEELIHRAPQHALAQYLMGVALTGAEETADAAAEHFRLARDYDTLRFRADSQLNTIIRQLAEETLRDDDIFLDVEQLLARRSPAAVSLPGNEAFYEHVHFNPHGNFSVALALAEVLAQADSQPWPHPALHQMTAEEFNALKNDTARQVGFTPLEVVRITDDLLHGLLAQPPFVTRWNAENYLTDRTALWEQQRPQFLKPHNIIMSSQIVRNAAAARPDDLYLQESHLLQAMAAGSYPTMEEQARKMIEAIPADYLAWTHLGTALLQQNKLEPAREAFQEALRLNPHFRVASNNLQVAEQRSRQQVEESD